MLIRYTNEDDLKGLPYLYRQNYNGDSHEATDTACMREKFAKLSTDENYKFVSAVENGTLIGFCAVVVVQNIVKNQKPTVTIWSLRVLPAYRGQGVGSKMLTFIENFAQSIGASDIQLTCAQENLGGQNFYTQNGYDEDLSYYKNL